MTLKRHASVSKNAYGTAKNPFLLKRVEAEIHTYCMVLQSFDSLEDLNSWHELLQKLHHGLRLKNPLLKKQPRRLQRRQRELRLSQLRNRKR